MSAPDPHPNDHKNLRFERFVFFSDAVFAIAITLLVLDLKLPSGGVGAFDLAPLVPKFICFGLSFYVIGRYWMAHHALFDRIQACDTWLLAVNLAFLASIAFLPFPTSAVILERPSPGPVVFYTLSVTAVGLLMLALIAAACRPHLRKGETPGSLARRLLNAATAPVVFATSAGVAVVHPRMALWVLLALIPAGSAMDAAARALQTRIDRGNPQTQAQ